MPAGKYHPLQERCVSLLCTKTQSENKHFYRLLCAYYFSKMASMLRTNIHTKERGVVCVNTYIMNLLMSGEGKGHSTNIFEENLICGFREEFMKTVFPHVSVIHLGKLASIRAVRDGIEEEAALTKMAEEFESLGVLPFSFDAATGPALKQLRQKLLLASAGSMNIEIDEIGSNLLGNAEALTVLLELYDKGLVKPKLVKNTKESVRSEDVIGYTPTNLMMFGTPMRLFDGGKTEDELTEWFGSGYARRLLFGYSGKVNQKSTMTAAEIYDALTDTALSNEEASIRRYFTQLASVANFGKQIEMDRDVSIDLIQYKIDCERRASKMGNFDEVLKAEMTHRYFKVMKLAGAYAFIDRHQKITQDNLNYAIELTEDSGENFKRIQQRDAPYIRLAKFLAETKKKVTQVDLVENLQFFKGTEGQRKQMMTFAIAYGYKNNIIIKRSFIDDIEFFLGESLEVTDLSRMIVSHSAQITENYSNDIAPFDDLYKLTSMPGHNFINHHLMKKNAIDKGCYRDNSCIIPKFNLCIIDVDGGTQMHVAKEILADYKFLIYETKRSTDVKNRFRLILPLSHTLKLDEEDYKEFMLNVFNWLPFECDIPARDRTRKWLTHDGKYIQNDGILLDVNKFIPRTDAAVKEKTKVESMENLSNIERWFAQRIKPGCRNSMMLRYALALLDNGKLTHEVQAAMVQLNHKIEFPLDENEIIGTIMKTVTRKAKQPKK